MPDNILRIEFEDTTAAQAPASGGGGAPSPGGGHAAGPGTPAHGRGSQPFDPIAAGQARLNAEQKKAEVDHYYNIAKYGPGGNPPGSGAMGAISGAARIAGAAGVPGAGMMAGVLAAAGPIGLAVAAVAAVATSVHMLDSTLKSHAESLSPYSGPLAAAQGQAQVAQVQGDIGRADKIGKELAGFTEARSRLDQAGQDALVNILKPLIPIATQVAENLAIILEGINKISDGYDATIGQVVKASDVITGVFELSLMTIAPELVLMFEVFSLLKKWLGSQEKDPVDDALDALMKIELPGEIITPALRRDAIPPVLEAI